MDLFQIILSPFVWLLMTFYRVFGDYGVALIVFALVVKIILFPFSLKGKRGMIQMNMLSAQMNKLQKQYGKDKERYNLEVQKLYQKEHVSPMSGCLWSFLPLLILFPLYAIIRQPLKYMMGLSPEQIGAVGEALNWATVAADHGWIKQAAEFANTGYNQLFLASMINESTLPAAKAVLGEGTRIFAMNFQFFGINLSQIPQLKFWANGLDWGAIGLFILPIISAATGFVFSLISMKTNGVNNQAAQQAATNATSKTMLFMSPLMSLWIGFAMPAALCVYWIANNVFSMLQEFICGKLLKKDYAKAAAAKEAAERQEKEEEKERKRQATEERTLRIEEAKNNKGKKKPAPKKKDEDDEKIPASVKEVSRVGMRQYARGRAYDPYRYGEPTAYYEPGKPVTVKEEDSRELEKETELLEEVALEEAADDAIIEATQEDLEATQAEDAAEEDASEKKE